MLHCFVIAGISPIHIGDFVCKPRSFASYGVQGKSPPGSQLPRLFEQLSLGLLASWLLFLLSADAATVNAVFPVVCCCCYLGCCLLPPTAQLPLLAVRHANVHELLNTPSASTQETRSSDCLNHSKSGRRDIQTRRAGITIKSRRPRA